MKTVAENYAMGFHEWNRSSDDPLHDVLLGKIGEDLREIYGGMAESELPRSLLALAQALDARLTAGNGDS